MLRQFFPSTKTGAALYECYLSDANTVFRIYDLSNSSFENVLSDVNTFLTANGYSTIDKTDFDVEKFYEEFPVSFHPHGYQEKMILTLERDIVANTQFDFVSNELKKFRNERDWKQFHNPKDLSIALSIEANELLELFLWKKPEDANLEKVKEELADVFAYAFLIAEKYNLNVEEIVLDKIQKNAEKYPVEKAKGKSDKYDQL
jgi:NTP pyrophosphatase (non-canonical NTP hydrolase)